MMNVTVKPPILKSAKNPYDKDFEYYPDNEETPTDIAGSAFSEGQAEQKEYDLAQFLAWLKRLDKADLLKHGRIAIGYDVYADCKDPLGHEKELAKKCPICILINQFEERVKK